MNTTRRSFLRAIAGVAVSPLLGGIAKTQPARIAFSGPATRDFTSYSADAYMVDEFQECGLIVRRLDRAPLRYRYIIPTTV